MVGGFVFGTVACAGSRHAARCGETGSQRLAPKLDLQTSDGAGACVLKAMSAVTWLVISLFRKENWEGRKGSSTYRQINIFAGCFPGHLHLAHANPTEVGGLKPSSQSRKRGVR